MYIESVAPKKKQTTKNKKTDRVIQVQHSIWKMVKLGDAVSIYSKRTNHKQVFQPYLINTQIQFEICMQITI